ncbi:glutaredoxin family protein [Aliikangiella coralliicola]|uniref:Glutaredoxin family protein n=1 Tax=Aliikangiella coralliicola TaxID=2592383 RepID=A0A545TWI2_9GAMM|nr:glutaredoxin family protein [Aliikangiella coralliicola]TQV81575.1 glutaredoxin family protein [Aliikangiella coralliicola]
MSQTIQLYTTAGCHLCEQVEAMMEYLIQNDDMVAHNFDMLPVEIAGDEALVERYGIRIPVLASSTKELGWPFELEELREWLIAT